MMLFSELKLSLFYSRWTFQLQIDVLCTPNNRLKPILEFVGFMTGKNIDRCNSYVSWCTTTASTSVYASAFYVIICLLYWYFLIFLLKCSHKGEIKPKVINVIICRQQSACPHQNCTKCGFQDKFSGFTSLNQNFHLVACHLLGDSKVWEQITLQNRVSTI